MDTTTALELANLTYNIGVLTAVVKEDHSVITGTCDRLFSSIPADSQVYFEIQSTVCKSRQEQSRGYRQQLLGLKTQAERHDRMFNIGAPSEKISDFFKVYVQNLDTTDALLTATAEKLESFNSGKKIQPHVNKDLAQAFGDLDDVQQFFNGNIKPLVAKSDSVDQRLYAEGKMKLRGALKTLSEYLTGDIYCDPWNTSQDLLRMKTPATTPAPTQSPE
jgi:hypothetical protein